MSLPVEHLPVEEFIEQFLPRQASSWEAWFSKALGPARREHTEALLQSVKRAGQIRQPVKVREGVVRDGHHRVAVAWLLNLPIPYWIVPLSVHGHMAKRHTQD